MSKKMFPQFSSLKYKLFVWWKRHQYIKFIRKENVDFDYCSILDMNILKLTMMGLQFAKFGVIIDEDRKKQVRTIWAARKQLKNSRDAFDIIWNKAQKNFKEKYGFEYNSEIIWEKIEEGKYSNMCVKLVAPDYTEEQKKEMTEFWNNSFSLEDEFKLEKESLKKAFEIIQENIFLWWD